MEKRVNWGMKLWVLFLVIFGFSSIHLTDAVGKPINLVIHDPAMSRGYTKAWE